MITPQCDKPANWELHEEDPYMLSYSCHEHLSELIDVDKTIYIEKYDGEEPCCYTGVSFDTIDGCLWVFVGEKKVRRLSDEEAARVIWGDYDGLLERLENEVLLANDQT